MAEAATSDPSEAAGGVPPEGTPKVDRRRARSKATKRALILATVRSLADRGLSSTTLTTVSALSGLSRGLVGFHFSSKAQMLADTLQFIEEEYDRSWRAAVKDPDLPPFERLAAWLDHDLTFVADNPHYLSAWFAFWGEARGNAIYREVILPRDRAYVAFALDQIKTLAETRGGLAVAPETLAQVLSATIVGLWLEVHLDPQAFDLEVSRQRCRSLLAAFFPEAAGPS